jgi:PadR family transcriptional regulator PadR
MGEGGMKDDGDKRRAHFLQLTAAGRRQLGIELSQFEQMIAAVGRVLIDTKEA